jgi:hypothetical protein
MSRQSIISRRQLVARCGAALLAPKALTFSTSAAADTRFPAVSFPRVVDCSVRTTAEAQNLADAGVRVVMRYYARALQRGLESKILLREEAEAIHNAKMAIGLTYQYYNRHIACFAEDEAKKAAEHCLKQDKRLYPDTGILEHPEGTVVYFGIDSDFPVVNMSDKKVPATCPPDREKYEVNQYNNDIVIEKYFEIIGNIFHQTKSPLRLGVYGAGRFCRMLSRKGIRHFWLPGSTGWAGTPEFYNAADVSPPWTFYQNAVEVPFGSIAIDTNIVNPKASSLGVFDANGLVKEIDDEEVRKLQRFATERAIFLETPDRSARRIEHPVFQEDGKFSMVDYIPRRKMITLLGKTLVNGLVKVGATFTFRNNTAKGPQTGSEYGVRQIGYVQMQLLQEISKMPY